MSVLAIFRYDVKPGRTGDFIEKLQKAAGPEFNSEAMPKAVRIFRSSVPGPDTAGLILVIEYEDMGTERVRRLRIRIPSGESYSRRNPIRRSDWFPLSC